MKMTLMVFNFWIRSIIFLCCKNKKLKGKREKDEIFVEKKGFLAVCFVSF